jgi:integrase
MSKISSKKYKSIWLYHLKNGDITYYITHKVNGKTKWVKVGRKFEGVTEKKAFDYKNSLLLKKRLGTDLSQKNYKYLTFNEVAEQYFNSSQARNKSNRRYKLMYQKHIKDILGNKTLDELESSLIYKLQSNKKDAGLSDSTINIIVKLVKRIVGFAIKEEMIAFNPFKNIQLLKVNNSRLRYLTTDEINKLYELIDNDTELELFVRLALGTGARANSVLSITKKDINIELKSVTLQDFKRNNTYIGYLNDKTYKIVIDHIKNISLNSLLIKQSYQNIYLKLSKMFNIFNSELDKSDRANRVVIHTLRHTFASHLAIAGVPIQKIQKLMNHKDIKQTMKYAKLMPDSGRSDVENLYKNNQNKVVK